ncbi:MAG TPA: BatD family protein, partial [Acidobacteriota bacterium]|nr:BatD family protein [Acidobacteriota bacterium]
LEPPAVSIPPDVERFDPKISNSITPQGTRIEGSRTFEYLLIPRHAGDQKIPPFTFSYFDTDQQKFVTLRSAEFVLKVDRGAESEAPSVASLNREDVKLLGEDIRFIKSGNVSFRRRGTFFAGSVLFYLLVLSPPFVFVLFLTVLKRRENMLTDVFAVRSRNARKVAQQRLAKAGKLLQEKKQVEFYAEVSRALWGYLSDRLGIPVAELSREAVQAALQARSVTTETIVSIAGTMDQCEFARFAPAGDSLQMENFFQGAVRLVSSIEDQLR